MRAAVAALFVVALSAPPWLPAGLSTLLGGGVAIAQSRAHQSDGSTDELPSPSIGLPLPPIGLPLPSIGLPLPPTGLPPRTAEGTQPLNRPEQLDRQGRFGGTGRFDGRRGSVVFLAPAYGWPYPYAMGTPAPSLPSPAPTGRLHLDLQPGVDPQIYVDGYYVGLLSDTGGELTVDAGTHTIELREEGFETLHVGVQVPLDGLITYRGELKRSSATEVRQSGAVDLGPNSALPDVTGPRSEVPPTTIYLIPGCYVGNVPPVDAFLPVGCHADRAIAYPSR